MAAVVNLQHSQANKQSVLNPIKLNRLRRWARPITAYTTSSRTCLGLTNSPVPGWETPWKSAWI